eukprot:COSAG06_NODE_4966_length_3824_cov_13.185772_3_plen_405_part_00
MAQTEERTISFDPRDTSVQDRSIYGPGFGPSASSRGHGHPDGAQSASAADLAEHILMKDAPLVTEPVTQMMTFQRASISGFDLKLEPLCPSIGTIVHGCDLAALPEHPALIAFLRELWLDRRVIFFRAQQTMSREEHRRFIECFGEHGGIFGERGAGNDPPEASGRAVFHAVSSKGAGAASNWHSDASWAPRPPMGSALLCHSPPPVGGDTLFCDAYAMWAALPPATRQRLEGLQCTHSSFFAQPGDKDTESSHPAARTHPETGGTTLWVTPRSLGGFTTEFLGVDEDENAELMRQCEKVTGRPDYTCRFRWGTSYCTVLYLYCTVLSCGCSDPPSWAPSMLHRQPFLHSVMMYPTNSRDSVYMPMCCVGPVCLSVCGCHHHANNIICRGGICGTLGQQGLLAL